MKTKMLSFILLFFVAQILISCNKDPIVTNSDLLGGWINISNNNDTITFSNEKVVIYNNDFAYKIENDSIEFRYIGDLLPVIYCPTQKFHFHLSVNNDTLIIINFNRLCFVGGNESVSGFFKYKNFIK